MSLLPHVTLVKEGVVFSQVVAEIPQPLSALHHHAHVNELVFRQGGRAHLKQPASHGLGRHVLDDNLRRMHACSKSDLRLEGSLNTPHVASEAGVGSIELDRRCNLLGVRALEASHAATAKQR